MAARKALQLLFCTIAFATGFAEAAPLAQDISLNYESLSSLEDPLATEIGDMTFVLTGLLDTPLVLDLEDDNATAAEFIGNVQIDVRTQLPNRWRVGLTYFGQHASDRTFASGSGDGYTDNIALSVGSFWGTVLVGNISGVVREQTRRLRGAGNASLALDDVYGGPEDDGGSYLVRFGPWVFSALVDEDENFDFGAVYQRPTGTRDYRLSARYTDSEYTPAGGSRTFSTTAFSGVGEIIYGSTQWDLGAGYERFTSSGLEADRWYVSTGVRTKAGVLSLSAEGHYGQIESEDEVSASLGLQYDLARGLSTNLGLNYAEAKVSRDGVSIVDTKEKKAIVSMRYSF